MKAITSLLIAPEVLPFGLMGERFRRLSMSFPASYQILPTYPCAVDQNGQKINFLEDESWLSEEFRPMLREGRQFRQELGRRSSVPAISIFGYGIKTITGITLKRSPDGALSDIAYQTTPSGDSTILERSAVLEGSERPAGWRGRRPNRGSRLGCGCRCSIRRRSACGVTCCGCWCGSWRW